MYNNGSLTVTDNSQEQTGTIEGGGTQVITNQSGTLNLEGGTIKGDGLYAITNKGTLNLEGGAVEGGTNTGINNQGSAGTLNLESGTVKSDGIAVGANGGTVTISKDVTVEGGKTGVLVQNSGTLETEGTISGGTYGINGKGNNTSVTVNGGSVTGVSDGIRLENGAEATIDGEDTTITATGEDGKSSSGISVWKNATVTVNNGTISGGSFGISGNGTKENGQRWYGDTTITVAGGKVTGVYAGIYHPQFGTLNVSGGEISGITGIEMRAGTLNISGGKVTGNYTYNGTDYAFGAEHKGGALTTFGVGVAVSQHVTDEQIVVNISDGTLEGYYALFEKDLANTDKGDVTLNITGGKLVSTVHENPEADTNRVNNVTTPEYNTNDAVKVMDDYKFFATGGMSTDKIAEDYLGYLTEEEMAKFPYNNKETDGKVSCIEVIPQDDELLFQVGYLTARNLIESEDEIDMTLNVGGDDGKLEPQLYLSGRAVSVKELSKVVAENGWDYDKNVVRIDENGKVTAVAAGTTEVTITLINGETVTFTIAVEGGNDIPNVPNVPNNEVEIDDVDVPLAGLFTRADAIGYLWEQSGSPEWELSDFDDVPEDHEWAVAIGWAQDMGIALPDEDGNFRPDDLVLRSVESLEISPEGELQEFLNRYAVYAGIELDEGELFIELEGSWDDVIMGEEAQVIFDDFFAKLELALAGLAA
ncbi:MAG: hypothetical protein HDT33_06225 [Clostridiales bacterium]|nr:hypothetical protein [Clostridiales bacterium]